MRNMYLLSVQDDWPAKLEELDVSRVMCMSMATIVINFNHRTKYFCTQVVFVRVSQRQSEEIYQLQQLSILH